MIETVLALVPEYGLMVVFGVVALACMAAALPTSVLTLTAGSFAAIGDLSLTMVLITTFLAYVVSDQAALLVARRICRPPSCTALIICRAMKPRLMKIHCPIIRPCWKRWTRKSAA
ncbi:MAG: hypothetical protein JJ920_20600 [Roseitalea sp.]|nr:hypothetical protein [Roseitalea sp.]MBO6723518.1 hypothetical protein [Roseitalea sp.]MBO6745314.1 hypothetical protein [Roseitalea sp.]